VVGVLFAVVVLGMVGVLLSMLGVVVLLSMVVSLSVVMVVVAFVSRSAGGMLDMSVGHLDATFDHTAGSRSSNMLNQLLADESGSEFDSSYSSKCSLLFRDSSRLVGSDIFFSDLLSDLSSDSSQLGEGLVLVVLDVNDDFVDCDNGVASSRSLDLLHNVLGGMFSNLPYEVLAELLEHLFNGVLDGMSDLLQALV